MLFQHINIFAFVLLLRFRANLSFFLSKNSLQRRHVPFIVPSSNADLDGFYMRSKVFTIDNFRPLVPGISLPLYRSAALDNVTAADVAAILSRIQIIIDLRNTDEILSGYDLWRFKGAFDLYAAFVVAIASADSLSQTKSVFDATLHADCRYIFQLPVFGKIQPFWEIVKKEMLMRSSMSPYEKLIAEGRWLFNPQGLSDRLVHFLGMEGLPLLYFGMLENSMPQFRDALLLCLKVCEQAVVDKHYSDVEAREFSPTRQLIDEDGLQPLAVPSFMASLESSDDNMEVVYDSYKNGLLLHCAQGKDRTGLVAMLFQFALFGDSDVTKAYAVNEYAMSESLLMRYTSGDGDGERSTFRTSNTTSSGASSSLNQDTTTSSQRRKSEDGVVRMGLIGSLRGSPPAAMEATIDRLRSQWGSVEGYLDRIGFDERYRRRLRKAVMAIQIEKENRIAVSRVRNEN